jgi:hypothetical protein
MQWRGLTGRKLSTCGCNPATDLDGSYQCTGTSTVALWGGATDAVKIADVVSRLGYVVRTPTEELHGAFQPTHGAVQFHPSVQTVDAELAQWRDWLASPIQLF